MKNLMIVLLAMLSFTPAFAQHPPQEEVPVVRRGPPPGPGGGGFGRCQDSLSKMTATIEQVVADVISRSGPKSQADMDTIGAYQNELRECNQMRAEFVAECVRKNALALVQLAFTNSLLCEGQIDEEVFLNSTPGNAAPEYIKLGYGTKVGLIDASLQRASNGLDYIHVRVLAGPHAGREGYIFHITKSNLTCLPPRR